MKYVALALMVLCIPAACAGALDDDTTDVNGDWQIVQKVYTPNDATSAVASLLDPLGKQVRIKDGSLTSRDAGKTQAFAVSIDLSKYPRTMDLTLLNGNGTTSDQVLLATYTIKDNVLTIDVGTNGNRPTETDTDDSRIRVVLIVPGG